MVDVIELRHDLSFDPADPEFISNPYPTYAALRESARVFRDTDKDRWFVTRFEDVRDCLRDRRLGRIFWHLLSPEEFGGKLPVWMVEDWPAFNDAETYSLLSMEPPDHTRIRRLITAAFTPRAVESLRDPAEQISAGLLDPLIEAGGFEVTAQYAQPYSIALISRLLGVPYEDRQLLLDWSHAMVKMYEFNKTPQQKFEANRAAAEFRDYCLALIAARRVKPTDDLISALVHADVEGAKLTDPELVSTIITLLNAGHEATVNTIGNGVVAFVSHPDQWRRVTSGEVTALMAAEEVIRWDAPLQLFERYVLQDGFAIGSVEIPRGERVALLFGSANHDPRRFPDPDRFDVGRNDSHHVGFGGGAHFCIGAPLARLELDVAVRQLADRLPDLQLSSEPVRHPTFQFRGFAQVHVAA